MAAIAENIHPSGIGPKDAEQLCFKFEGTDIFGAETKMYIYATDEEQAAALLARAKIQVEAITPHSGRLSRKKKRLSREELGTFAIQLAERTRASDPIPQAITDIARASSNPLLREALMDVYTELRKESVNVHDAFNVRPDVFPDAFRHIIRVGTRKGDPSDMLYKYGERQILTAENIAKVRGALIYPAVVLNLAAIVVFVLCFFILPKMREMYTALLETTGAQLPLMTRILLGFSNALVSWPGIACTALAIFGIVMLVRWLRTDQGSDWLQRKSLGWPLIGKLLREFNAAHVVDLMSILAPVVIESEFLKEAAAASLNVVYRERLEAIRQSFIDGALDLKTAVIPYAWLFGDEFVAAVATGTETGRLPTQLGNYARLLDRRVQDSTARLSKTVEPLTLVVAGLAIGFIVISAYWPLFSLVGELANKK
jgi:type IV pilus assembly protein PilC